MRGGGGLRRAAEPRFLGAGGGLRGPRGGAHELPLAAARSRNPSAFHVGGAIITPTFATSSASSVRAVFLRLVPAVLTGGGAGGGGTSEPAATASSAATLEKIRVFKRHGFNQVGRRILPLLMMLPQLHTAAASAAASVVQQILIRRSATTETRLRETRCSREKRDHADGIGGIERMRVEIDCRGGGGLGVVVVLERRSGRDEEELRGKAAIEVRAGGSSSGRPHSGGGGCSVGDGGSTSCSCGARIET